MPVDFPKPTFNAVVTEIDRKGGCLTVVHEPFCIAAAPDAPSDIESSSRYDQYLADVGSSAFFDTLSSSSESEAVDPEGSVQDEGQPEPSSSAKPAEPPDPLKAFMTQASDDSGAEESSGEAAVRAVEQFKADEAMAKELSQSQGAASSSQAPILISESPSRPSRVPKREDSAARVEGGATAPIVGLSARMQFSVCFSVEPCASPSRRGDPTTV
eukprot:4881692-Pyramimonas_sp.AAC.2